MRPLLVDLGRDFRGGQHQALLLLEGLLARGHAPELMAVRDFPLARRAKDAGISVHGVAPGCRRIAATMQIRHLIHSNKVDLVHANEPHALSAAWLACAHRAVPVIAARRIAIPLSPSFFPRARYRAAARIVAVSRFVAQSVIASGLPTGCVEVIYDGVEIPAALSAADRETSRGRIGIPRESWCIGNAAAFVPEKGHALLVRAFAALRGTMREDARKASRNLPGAEAASCFLLLRGDGPELAAMRELAAQLQILDAVKFLPQDTDLKTLFAATDCFAFPSHAEPLGSALLAAMAQGLAPVAIARGGIPEVIEHEKNGLLVNSLDPEAFAAALALLAANPEQASLFGRAARETIATRFSADHMVDATLQLYERVRFKM